MTLGWPSNRQIRLLAALIVVVLGVGYALTRSTSWESRAELTLTPERVGRAARTAVLEAFDRSGTIGTYVEVIGSRDTLTRAGAEGFEVEARAIPDTRVIEVSAVGDQDEVQLALAQVLRAAREPDLRDLWRLAVSEGASEPVRAGPSTLTLLFATALLAALAAIATPIIIDAALGDRGDRSVVESRTPAAPGKQPSRSQRRPASSRERETVPP